MSSVVTTSPNIHLSGLGLGEHRFVFSLGSEFLRAYGGENTPQGKFTATVDLLKRSAFIQTVFSIDGHLALVCDRSLQPFDHPLHLERKMLFKYGDVPRELDGDIAIIEWNATRIEVGQLIYEWVMLTVPIKKVHPEFVQQDASVEDEQVYSTASATQDSHEDVNPLWKKLLSIKQIPD